MSVDKNNHTNEKFEDITGWEAEKKYFGDFSYNNSMMENNYELQQSS